MGIFAKMSPMMNFNKDIALYYMPYGCLHKTQTYYTIQVPLVSYGMVIARQIRITW